MSSGISTHSKTVFKLILGILDKTGSFAGTLVIWVVRKIVVYLGSRVFG